MVLALAISSQLFLIPVIVSMKIQSELRYLFLSTYITSVGYHYTESNYLLYIDITLSRFTAVMLLYHYIYVRKQSYLFTLSMFNKTCGCYVVSRILSSYDNPIWVAAHTYFHIWSAISCIVGIYWNNSKYRLRIYLTHVITYITTSNTRLVLTRFPIPSPRRNNGMIRICIQLRCST